MIRFTIRIPVKLSSLLDELAKERVMSKNALINLILRNYLNHKNW